MKATAIKEIKAQIKHYQFKVDSWKRCEEEHRKKTTALWQEGLAKHSLYEYRDIANEYEEESRLMREAGNAVVEFSIFISKLKHILDYLEEDEEEKIS